MASRILSLGAGVQSSAVLLMSLRGELPPLDAAVFADTGWEPQAVYKHLDWLEGVAREHGLPVCRVSAGNIKHDALRSQVRGTKENGQRWASMPYFVLGPNGEKGMIRRQCTREYKIDPIERWIKRDFLGYEKYARIPAGVVQRWVGISVDEFQRAKPSRNKWEVAWFPLVEKRIARAGCLVWMEKHGYPEPPRSACIGCPYHHNREWRWLRDNSPTEFQDAIEFDEAIRNCGGMRGEVFLHRTCKPLSQVDLRTDLDRGQLSLWQDECAGICGV